MNETVEMIDTAVRAVQEEAQRLGLVWQLVYGTVTVAPSPQATGSIIVQVDGDDTGVPVPVVNLAGALAAGARVAILQLPPAGLYAIAPVRGGAVRVSNTQDTASTRAVITYANLTNIAGVAFVAPPSGEVTIEFDAFMENNNAAGASLLSPAVFEGDVVGSGTTFLAATDPAALVFNQAIVSEGLRYGSALHVTGLTPYALYNVSLQGRTNGTGTSTFDSLHTIVDPVL